MNHTWIIDRNAAFGADRSVSQRSIERRISRRSYVPPQSDGTGWLEHARRALATSEFHTAAYAARKARHQNPETAEVWTVLARAHAGMERFEDAVVEAQRAIKLAPKDAETHLTLASVFADLGNWTEALRYYLAAAGLDPRCDAAHVGAASVFLRNGDPYAARRILEDVYARTADPRVAGDYLALALTEVAELVPEVRDHDTYFITSDTEIASMRTLLTRAAKVAHDPDLQAGIARVRRYVDGCARREFVSSRMLNSSLGRLGLATAGLLIASATVTVVLLGLSVPVLGAAALALTAVGYGQVRYTCVPRWRLNRLAHERELAG
ncbi:MAG TPA: tetratricopeptide repeat protein [Micromonosporaceae bacterium]|nr:tetratricopeptide repeat protein [Micromonosporaceae bacterium]